jgi:hypothetical protein
VPEDSLENLLFSQSRRGVFLQKANYCGKPLLFSESHAQNSLTDVIM